MPETAAFCPGCGRVADSPASARSVAGVLPDPLAGAMAYFLLPAVVFLFVEPYCKNRFVRFHAWQCIMVYLFGVAVGAAIRMLAFFLFFIPLLGHLLVWLLVLFAVLAWLMLWIVLIVKALQGEMFKLPLVGSFAEKQAG
jgi:uncharacterized membrane protein